MQIIPVVLFTLTAIRFIITSFKVMKSVQQCWRKNEKYHCMFTSIKPNVIYGSVSFWLQIQEI